MQEAPDQQLSTAHVACVRTSVENVFTSLIGETPQYIEQRENEDVVRCEGILGVISLVGDVGWSLGFGLPSDTAPALTELFCGFAIPFDSPDMADATGELTNVLAGELKVELDGIGIKADISLPQVLRGNPVELMRLPNAPFIVLSFNTSTGPFVVALTTGSTT